MGRFIYVKPVCAGRNSQRPHTGEICVKLINWKGNFSLCWKWNVFLILRLVGDVSINAPTDIFFILEFRIHCQHVRSLLLVYYDECNF